MPPHDPKTVNYAPIRALRNTPSDLDFAILIPQNRLAKAAFSALILHIASHEHAYPDADRFIRLHPLPAPASGLDQLVPHAPTSGNIESTRWSSCGHFALNLSELDQGPPTWAVGKAISTEPRRRRILLSPPSPEWQNRGIVDDHFELTFEAESYRMLLIANGTVDLKHDTLMNGGSHSVENGDIIGLGDCTYTLMYTDYSKGPQHREKFQALMGEKYNRGRLGCRAAPRTATAFPTVQIGNYRCSAADFQNATLGGIFRGWFRKSAKVVAIKEHKSMVQAESLREMMDIIGRHENLISIIDVVGGLDDLNPKAYCILSPLGIGTLATYSATHIINLAAQVMLSKDWACGIKWLHTKGKVHTNINPYTLSIVGYENPTGIVTHLDDVVDEQEQNGDWPIPKRDCRFIAPEVMSKLTGEPEFETESVLSTDGFRRASDIFGLGMSINFMVSGGRYVPAAFDGSREEEDRNHEAGIPDTWTTKRRLRRVAANLKRMKDTQGEPRRQFLSYGRKMLAWEPKERYTATETHVLMQALASKLGVGRIELLPTSQRGTKRGNGQISS